MAALAAHRPQQAHTVHPERIDFDDDHLQRTFNNSLAAAKPLTLAALLEQPIRFVEPRHALDDDKVPYSPINVKPTPKASPSKVNGATPSVNGSPIASTSKLPAASTPTNGPSKRLFPVVDTTAVWARPYKAGAGLRNLGNTCFLNSALQVLLHTPPLVRYLETQTQHAKTSCPVLERKGFCMICALRMCVKQSFTGNTPAYSPTPIVKNLRLIAKHFRLGRQEDSHEFLRFTVDALQAAALFGHPPKLDQKLKEQTFVHQLFGGRLCSRVHCQSCGHNSDTHDSILDLSLDLNGARSVKDALDNLVKLDHLKGQNKYKCEMCKKLVNAEKGFKIETAPVVLTVHLKRFTPTGRKAGQPVSYHESLKLGGYMSNPDSNPSYKLYGVVLHSGGGPHSGHYTAYVRAANGNWYDMNDDYVRQVPTRQVLNDRDAYMLFYIRERGQALHDVINGAGPASQSSAQKANGNNKRPRESYPSPRVSNGVAASPSAGKEGASTATAVGSPVPRPGEPAPKRIRPTPVGVSDPTTASPRGGASESNAGASSPAVKVQFPFLPGAADSESASNGPTSSPSRPATPVGPDGAASPAAAAASSPKVKPFQSRTGQGVTLGTGSGPRGSTQPGSAVKLPVVGRLKPRKKKNRALVSGKGVQVANKPRVIEG